MEVDEGRAVFVVEPQELHYNPIGAVHGGLALTLIDSATGCAVQSLLPADVGYTTLDPKVNFIRAIALDAGVVRCTGEAVHAGARPRPRRRGSRTLRVACSRTARAHS